MKRVDEIIKGITILKKYEKGGYGIQAEHDVIFFNVDKAVAAADEKSLKKIGWFLERDTDPLLWSKYT